MSENILITGGAGFIGSNLACKLNSKGHSTIILDNLSPQIHSTDPDNSYTYNVIKNTGIFIKGDVRNRKDWQRVFENDIDIIVHLAAETGTGQSMYEIEKYVDVNTRGTALLLDFLAQNKHHVKKIILASSRAIYGEGKYLCQSHGIIYPERRLLEDMVKNEFECRCPYCNKFVSPLPTDEGSAIKPSSIYAVTKYNQEQLVLAACKALEISTIILRLQNVYGPGQSLKNPYTGILSIFSSLIRQNKEINVFEDGNESRDFIYIDDVVESIYHVIQNKSVEAGTFNVGTGNPTTVLDLVKILAINYGVDVKQKISGNFRLGDIRHNFADSSKIKNIIGFVPNIKLENGIKNFVDWVLTQELIDNCYENSIDEMKNNGLFK